MQAAPWAMQAPAHSLVPLGHPPPHDAPSQVALPPMGIGQLVQEFPQLVSALFETQALPQACIPVGQLKPQALPSQVAVAIDGAVQAVQEAPQVSGLVSATQAPAHR